MSTFSYLVTISFVLDIDCLYPLAFIDEGLLKESNILKFCFPRSLVKTSHGTADEPIKMQSTSSTPQGSFYILDTFSSYRSATLGDIFG